MKCDKKMKDNNRKDTKFCLHMPFLSNWEGKHILWVPHAFFSIPSLFGDVPNDESCFELCVFYRDPFFPSSFTSSKLSL